MRLLSLSLNARDQATVRSIVAFLEGRLEEKETIEWALGLGSGDVDIVKKQAILHLLDRPGGVNLREPWLSAWWLIKESWNEPIADSYGMLEVQVKQRLRSGERSEALVAAIVDLVEPRLEIEAYSSGLLNLLKLPNRPKKVHDLFDATLTSGKAINPASLKLEKLTEVEFIVSLANALDAVVMGGLDIARRIGWGRVDLSLRRVYYVSEPERGEGMHEPDKYNRKMAPSVKLLHAVVSQLVDIDRSAALGFISRWKRKDSPIHLRLWAAMSCDSRITPDAEVGDFILHLNYKVFWDVHHHPEIAELRARRFSEFDNATQKAITRRIRRGRPRNLFRNVAADHIEAACFYWAVRELKRIEVAGATLPSRDKAWLESNIGQFTDLAEMNRIDEGFLDFPKAQSDPTIPDRSLDSLTGIDRLQALEQALLSPRRGWDDDPADRAWDWLREDPVRILEDLESSSDGGAGFPKTWERFSLAHLPPAGPEQETNTRDLPSEAHRVINLLTKLPDEAISKAIKGISYWLSIWEKYVVAVPNWSVVWHRAWPLAVETTNRMKPPNKEPDLNTPVGELVGVFLAARPNLEENPRPFDSPSDLGKMRNEVINASERSGLIAKHRMLEPLRYFLCADQKWTEKHLIEPLRADDAETLALWRAVGRQTQFTDVLRIIGNDMVDRSTDHRLNRQTRHSLAFSLVIESLHALREGRDPAVAQGRVQQMIRSQDEEGRSYLVEAIISFVSDLSEANEREPNPPSPEHLFQSLVKPFLQNVWPQERSLTSPGISDRLSRLPAIARGEFAEAVHTIERFLVPFNCWSMIDYGLYRDDEIETLKMNEDETPKLEMIDDEAKAKALLRLLDRTIGTAENAVIPYDLRDALEQVRKVAPNLARNPEYRRLETAARRA